MILPSVDFECQAGQSRQGAAVGVMPAAVAFTLPTPPSTNALFKNLPRKGRVRTGAYDDWLGFALTAIRLQQVAPIAGRVVAVLGVERMSLQADLDNRLKAVLDVIVKSGIIDDDTLVTAIAAAWLPHSNGLTHVQLLSAQQLDLQFRPSPDRASGGWYAISPSTLLQGEDDGPEPL